MPQTAQEGDGLESIVQNAMTGDRTALQALCEKISKDVLFRATFICGNKTDAEDVSQETLIRVCINIEKLRTAQAFRGWLSRIVLNEARRHFEKNSKHATTLSMDEEDFRESVVEERHDVLPHENTEDKEHSKVVYNIISVLPVRQREIVMLHYYDDLNVTEVAKATGTSKANVSQTLKLAHKKLKEELLKNEKTNRPEQEERQV